MKFAKVNPEKLKEILEKAIKNGFNVLVESKPGTGKTSITREIISELEMKCIYYSVPTLDPFTDLTGVPKVGADGYLQFIRKKSSDDVEVMILDELNACSHYKTLNAIKELLIFKTINGIPFKNLKAIIGLMNPSDNVHNLFDLDQPLLERFHVKLELDGIPQLHQLQKVGIDEKNANLLIEWDKSLNYKYPARQLEYAFNCYEVGIDPVTVLVEIQDAQSLKSTLKNSQVSYYVKDDISNGRILNDLKNDKVKASIAVQDLIVRVKFQKNFWISDSFKEVFKELTPDSKAQIFSYIKAKYTDEIQYVDDLKKSLGMK